jgi:hypothetical protein
LHDDGRRVVYTGAIVQAFSEKFKRLFDYVYGIDWLALRGTDAGRGTEQSVGNVFHSVLPGFSAHAVYCKNDTPRLRKRQELAQEQANQGKTLE